MPFDSARIAQEDLVMFINACFACSGQAEFYSDARGQGVTIEFLHEYILGNYRRLYARTLAAGINHFNQGTIIVNLLGSGAGLAGLDASSPGQRQEEGALIAAALAALPPPRAYRVLRALRERRVNNRRARAVAREYLGARQDLHFDGLKYRPHLRAVTVHNHLRLPGQLGTFLFDRNGRGWHKQSYDNPLLESFRQAHYAREAVYELPYTIAEGFAARHGIPRDEFLQKIAPRLTARERLRLQSAAERLDDKSEQVQLDLDLGSVPLTSLALYILSLPEAARLARRDELHAGLTGAALRALRRAPARLGRVAAVLDRSYSSAGSIEKRRRPLAVALGASYLLRAAATEYRAFWTQPLGEGEEVLVSARGQTNLARPLLDALLWQPELVVILSDGFENDPPGGTGEVVRLFRARFDPRHRVSIVHMNPVFDSDRYAPRTLGPALPTVGLRDAEDLLTMLGFARFADGTAPLDELESYLLGRMRKLLGRHRQRSGAQAPVESEETA